MIRPLATIQIRVSLCAILVAVTVTAGYAQQQPFNCQYVEAWVDPGLGVDSTGGINDPDHPYRRLQTAIDAVIVQLALTWPGPTAVQPQGLVHALPGLYGPYAQWSGDTFRFTCAIG